MERFYAIDSGFTKKADNTTKYKQCEDGSDIFDTELHGVFFTELKEFTALRQEYTELRIN